MHRNALDGAVGLVAVKAFVRREGRTNGGAITGAAKVSKTPLCNC